jgi:caffeoyl-CoA O-methyltransferase
MIAEVNKKDILNYCELYSNNDSGLLKDLIKHTYKVTSAPQMISGIQVGNFLQSLILLSQSKSILEIGMFTGYSALKMAEVLPNRGTIDTCELADNHIETANLFFKKSKYGQKIKIHSGPALTSIKKFKENSFDMCFIDADKNNYINYYRQCIKLIKPNGFIVIDNMLWGGEVLNPKDKESKIIMETAQIVNNDSKVHNTMLTIRDGLMLCVKK